MHHLRINIKSAYAHSNILIASVGVSVVVDVMRAANFIQCLSVCATLVALQFAQMQKD